MLNWWTPSKPEQLVDKPWLSLDAINYFESILTPDMHVVEFGSGGSTLWLSEHVNRVTSIENNYAWYKEVRKHTKNNVLMYMDMEYLSKSEQFDLMFIDGEPVALRRDWLQAAPRLVKAGGWVILDNANRPEYELEREGLLQHADLIQTVNGNTGMTRYLVTEFFRMHNA